MSRRCLLLVLGLAVFTTSGLRAQVFVTLFTPPPGQLKVEHLWRVDIRNEGEQTYRDVWLHGEIHEAARGVVFRASTDKFDLPPGRMTLGYQDVTIREQWHASGFEVFVVRTGKVPAGDYTYLVELRGEGVPPARDHKTVKVGAAPPIRLVNPRDGATQGGVHPLFSWTGRREGDGSFELRVVPVRPGQSREAAILVNPPWFTRAGINTNTLRYPASAKPLAPDSTYAWQVRLMSGGAAVAESEVWEFACRGEPEPPGQMALLVAEAVESYEFRVTGETEVSGGVGGTSVAERSALEVTGQVDGANKSVHLYSKMGIPDGIQVDEYVVDGVRLSKVDGAGLPDRWSRLDIGDPDEWKIHDCLRQTARLLRDSVPRPVREEVVDGVACDVVELTPSQDAVFEMLEAPRDSGYPELDPVLYQKARQAAAAGERIDLKWAGVGGQTDLSALGFEVTDARVTLWIAKESHLLFKSEADLDLACRTSLPGPEGDLELDLTFNMTSRTTFSEHNQPADIELPAETRYAFEVEP